MAPDAIGHGEVDDNDDEEGEDDDYDNITRVATQESNSNWDRLKKDHFCVVLT